MKKNFQIQLKVSYSLTLKDARFVTGKNLQTFEYQRGSFGINNLTSNDFREFLKSWIDRPRRSCRLKCATFLISDNQKICAKEVLEELEAQPWDREQRDGGMWDFLKFTWKIKKLKKNLLSVITINFFIILHLFWKNLKVEKLKKMNFQKNFWINVFLKKFWKKILIKNFFFWFFEEFQTCLFSACFKN